MTTDQAVIAPKKLIEVALPLEAINECAQAEKLNPFIKGHPRSLHQYWARRPFTAARALLFAQLVNDPSYKWEAETPDLPPPQSLKASWASSRKRLFSLIEELAKWENTYNEKVLTAAREEVLRSWRQTCELNASHPQAAKLFDPEKPPAVYDPFTGGGAIPIEAQRLGLSSYASDLNPLAVIISKAMIELPYAARSSSSACPSGTHNQQLLADDNKGPAALAEDVRHYGQAIHRACIEKLSQHYPAATITEEEAADCPSLEPLVGTRLPTITWIWARTVRSPSPAFGHIHVPLISTFWLSDRKGREVYLEPLVGESSWKLALRYGVPTDTFAVKTGTKLARGAHFRCIMSGTAISPEYIKSEATAGRMGQALVALVADGGRKLGKVFLPASHLHETAAYSIPPAEQGDTSDPTCTAISYDPRALWCLLYGLDTFDKLFTARQLHTLRYISNSIRDIHPQIVRDYRVKHPSADQSEAARHANAVCTYLALALSRWTDNSNSIASWNYGNQNLRVCFTRQGIPMSWDFAEISPFAKAGGWHAIVENIAAILAPMQPPAAGFALQADAQTQQVGQNNIIATDPPYYDNVGYADLSDFFYVWLRRTLRDIYPDLLSSTATPKADELIAAPYRHGGKEAAERFFLSGMTTAMKQLSTQAHPAYPLTIYYAFKQSETEESGTVSTGWETFLEAVQHAGLAIVGTWPVRTEKTTGTKLGVNALASSIVLVCRKRSATAETISRRQFIRELNATLPQALDAMTRQSEGEHSPVAPVDLSQAIIGPGMAVFSKYAAVLEADGSPMTVRTALQLINRFLAEDDFDADTQFCLHWFEQHGWESGKFGEADTLARAKGTSVDGVKTSGVLQSAGGNVRLLKWADYKPDWDPAADDRLPVWEGLHQLVRVFKTDGESAAGKVLSAVAAKAEPIRQLAYRLYTLCERAGRAEDARAYNELITSWSPIESAAAATPSTAPAQKTLFE
jgi:putative DNA methylase